MAGTINFFELLIPDPNGPLLTNSLVRVWTRKIAEDVIELIGAEAAEHGWIVSASVTPVSGDPDSLIDGWRLEDVIADEEEAPTVAWRVVADFEGGGWGKNWGKKTAT